MSIRLLSLALLMLTAASRPAGAMTLKEFYRLGTGDQGVYIGGAVSMLAYSWAADGQVGRARCLRTWFFGDSKETPARGGREIMTEMNTAKATDPERFHIEGLILGAAEKACPAPSPGSRP